MVRYYKFWLVIWLCAGMNVTAQVPQYKVEILSTSEGLSQGSVLCLLQDKRGFIWAGTEDGLNRYDGYSFEVFRSKSGDLKSLSGSYINAITEDKMGNLWIGTTTGLNKFDWASQSFSRIDLSSISLDTTNIINNNISVVITDRSGNIWIGTEAGSIHRISLNKDSCWISLSLTQLTNPSGIRNDIRTIYEDRDGIIWIGSDNPGYNLYDPQKKRMILFDSLEAFPMKKEIRSFNQFLEDKENGIWGANHTGLFWIDKKNLKRVTYYLRQPNLFTKSQPLFNDEDGKVWIGTNTGLYYWEKGNPITNLVSDPLGKLPFNISTSIIKDRSGVIWIGMYGGLVKAYKAKFIHQKIPNGFTKGHGSQTIRSLGEDHQKNLWIGTHGAGLFKLDSESEIFTQYFQKSPNPYEKDELFNHFNSILLDNNQTLWIGKKYKGLWQVSSDHKQLLPYFSPLDKSKKLEWGDINMMLEDSAGFIWIGGNYSGLSRLNPKTRKIDEFSFDSQLYSNINSNDVWTYIQDRKGNFWVSFFQVGLVKFVPDSNNPLGAINKIFVHSSEDSTSLGDNTVNSIYEDSEGNIWVGTYGGGLGKYNPDKNNFTNYNTQNSSIPNNVVYAILPDDNNNLWISTNNGISKFSLETEDFTSYTIEDGLQGKEFNSKVAYKSSSGELFFGGVNGWNRFYPEKITQDKNVPFVVFTDFRLFNNPVPISEGKSLEHQHDAYYLKKHISEIDTLILPYDKNYFTFEFAALHYKAPKKNKYAYRMQGIDQDWQYVGNSRTATYTRLNHGTYLFEVKASNMDGIWNESGAQIVIIITPPWWLTRLAIFLWILLTIIVILGVFWGVISMLRAQDRAQNEHAEAERLKKLDQTKSNFFTNASHEFRTPLTLIRLPLEKLLQNEEVPDFVKERIQQSYNNTENIKLLIDQLLDLAKLEAKQMQIQLNRKDLIKHLSQILANFESLAKDKKIDFQFEFPSPPLFAVYDSDKIEKVMLNLLSNAFKFTEEGGTISVIIKRASSNLKELGNNTFDELICIVKDSGKGISPKDLPKIFDRYFQVLDSREKSEQNSTFQQSGTGIGLALTKQFVDLMEGEITVESILGKGSTFRFSIPLQIISEEEVDNQSNNIQTFDRQSISSSKTYLQGYHSPIHEQLDDRPWVLVVDDNREMQGHIFESLSKDYQILLAENGKIALQIAQEKIPDLIISDIMMPVLNGTELCRQLKASQLTSHIPVILLTARGGTENKIDGLEIGADDYITKPFKMRELMARAANLIQQRNKLWEKFKNDPFEELKSSQLNDADKQFLARLGKILTDNYADSEFTVEKFSEQVGITRQQLHRKLKALTSEGPNECIRNYRLRKATELLREGHFNASEVGYQVGFSSPSTFSKNFKELFGVTPTEYRNSSS